MNVHRISLGILYLITILSAVYLAAIGWEYYRRPQVERPHHALHAQLKPSGGIGHGVGIAGTALMLMLLLYSARKRFRSWQRFGNIRYWLNYHIWMGITGPLLVIFHTSFKVGGIVAVSFWSMIAVALSGALGRYIYIQIPRSLSGQELSRRELEEIGDALQRELSDTYRVSPTVLAMIARLGGTSENRPTAGWANLWFWLVNDLRLPFRLGNLRRQLRRETGIQPSDVRAILAIARRKIKLERRTVFLTTAHNLLHHWHVIHRPFALVMLLIMLVHVVVAVVFGYAWLFGSGESG